MHSLYTDGGARGNPGPAATGYFIFSPEGELVDFGGDYLGEDTNNGAEYKGIIAGLKLAAKHGIKLLKCNMDSELIVMQLNGAYRVKHPNLKPLFEEVKALRDKFEELKFVHIRRELNSHADKMVNSILDAIAK
jgi:ribonuclease HI